MGDGLVYEVIKGFHFVSGGKKGSDLEESVRTREVQVGVLC